jgi:TatD DNase family protein
MFTDTHTHLYSEEFDNDREEVLLRAENAGVRRFFLPNIDSLSIDAMMSLVENYPQRCFPMMGLHPCSVKENFMDELQIAEEWLKKAKFYGIGETGIDLFWDKTFIEEQKISFRIQIGWAKKYKLPIIIHARDSFNEILEIIDELNDESLTGIFHCFTGNEDDAKKIIGFGGFYLGIGGVVTFKNSGLAKTLAGIDPRHLVLETDSPYLAPVPFRGKRNESAYLTYISAELAKVYNCTVKEIAAITSANADKVFNLR